MLESRLVVGPSQCLVGDTVSEVASMEFDDAAVKLHFATVRVRMQESNCVAMVVTCFRMLVTLSQPVQLGDGHSRDPKVRPSHDRADGAPQMVQHVDRHRRLESTSSNATGQVRTPSGTVFRSC